MNIFLTGGTGFAGRNLIEWLEYAGHEVIAPHRVSVDWLNYSTFLKWHEGLDLGIDAVIHCASVGGKREIEDDPDIVSKNIIMTHNAYQAHQHLESDYFFIIGSGAEQNRGYGAFNMVEPIHFPDDYYGISKRSIYEYYKDKEDVYSLRAFGLFGPHEEEQRFIRSMLNSYLNKETMIIHKNRRMDFFYVADLGLIISDIILNKRDISSNINLSYSDRMLWLSDIAKYINTLDDHEVDVHFESSYLERDYYGRPTEFESKMSFIGQKEGIFITYQELKNEQN